jgi:hypothetical protein
MARGTTLTVCICLAIAVAVIAVAGCTNRDGTVVSNVTKSADRGTIGGDRDLPGKVNPAVTPGVRMTLNETQAAALDKALVTAQELGSAWDLEKAECGEDSCTASFTSTTGDSATSTIARYSSEAEAHSALEAAKTKSAVRVIVSLPLGDEAYGYEKGAVAEVGVRKGTTTVISTYVSASGTATMSEAVDLARAGIKKV